MIWLNGTLQPAEAAFSADDRGLLLGEAVFETLLVSHGVPQFWEAHLARLDAACTAFGLAPLVPRDSLRDNLRDGVLALLAAHDAAPRQVLRLTVTGGAGGRGLVPAAPVAANWLMQLSPAADPPQALRLHLSDIERPTGVTAQHKTSAYLDNIQARRAALAAGADEAVLVNRHGRVACAAAGNLFVQSGPRLITPPLSEGALPGIIRGALLQAGSAAGLEVVEGLVDRALLQMAEAHYVSNSLNGVVAAGFGAVGEAQKKQGRALSAALPQFTIF